MNLSLNEVRAMAKKAARGAGYPWGLAEEAASATAWLCAQDIDGVAALAGLLNAGLAMNLPDHMPKNITADWQGRGALCPLAAGALLSDLAVQDAQLRTVIAPVLLLPFVASVARRIDHCLTLDCDGVTALCDGHALSLSGTFPAMAEQLHLRAAGNVATPRAPQSRAAPDPADWQVLEGFAHRTYAPATEESRRLGAGGAD